MISKIFQGFCMAMADSVPGVSGGSIAFLMGFYNEFITSLSNLVSREKEKRKAAIQFLGKLAVGWVIGMGLAVTVLASTFDKRIYEISSLFLGFIIVAVITMIMDHFSELKVTSGNIICLIAGMVLVIAVTLLNHSSGANMELGSLTLTKGIYIFFAAMLAISAMVLPGISGSTLLLVFGLYIPVITAIKSLLHMDFSVFPALVIFGCGVLTGIVLFVRWIKLALENFPSQTMYAILGLMTGSLYAIVMGPTTLKEPLPPMGPESFHPVFFLVGAGLVLAMEGYRYFLEHSKKNRLPKQSEVSHS